MSSEYLYGNETELRSHIHSMEYKKPAENKALKFILVLISIILGVELVWLFGISPCMPLAKITITGIPGIDENAVLALAGIGKQSSFMTVNTKAAEEILVTLPMVRSAQVIKRFPNRLEINLESRQAAAIAFVSSGERIFPALIDGKGTVFNIGKEGFIQDETLPVISGLALEGVYSGMKLPRMYNNLFSRLENLALTAPELLTAISEIRINHRNYDGYDLTLYPAHKGVRVHISDLSEETLRYVLLMLDVLSAKSQNIEEIDFRTGTASYKEAYSG